MDLHEQANEALGDLLDSGGLGLDRDAESIARLMWLDGYKAGMDATLAKANEAFGEWAGSQIAAKS